MSGAGDSPYSIVEREFALMADGQPLMVQHIETPAVRLRDDVDLPTADDNSNTMLNEYFSGLAGSDLRLDGHAVIFGTYDNLHLGHKNMLRTGAAVCRKLYVGIESQEAALRRKKNKHPILGNDERRRMLVESGVTDADKVFVRTTATEDIIRLRNEGVTITTLIVGESQNDNDEVVEAVRYCAANGIRVLAVTRTRSLDPGRDISSSSLHKRGLAKVAPG